MRNTLNEQVSRIKNMMGLNEEREYPLVDLHDLVREMITQGVSKDTIMNIVNYSIESSSKEMKTSETDDQSSINTPERSRTKDYPDYHGSPYDRGTADSYYGREKTPHKGGVGGDSGPRTEDLTPDEVEAYMAGYEDNEASGDKKDWGEY